VAARDERTHGIGEGATDGVGRTRGPGADTRGEPRKDRGGRAWGARGGRAEERRTHGRPANDVPSFSRTFILFRSRDSFFQGWISE
jgi:hypothetical protein